MLQTESFYIDGITRTDVMCEISSPISCFPKHYDS